MEEKPGIVYILLNNGDTIRGLTPLEPSEDELGILYYDYEKGALVRKEVMLKNVASIDIPR